MRARDGGIRAIRPVDEPQLRSVALAKPRLDEQRNRAQLGRSLTHVERKLRLIRQIWSDEVTGKAD
jgi:hypothetical protein